MQVGDLIKMKNAASGTMWLVLQIVYDTTVLVANMKTSRTMWADKETFEVISASR